MLEVRPAEILRQLDESAPADRELLAQFVRHRDQAAFAKIGPAARPHRARPCAGGSSGTRRTRRTRFQAAFLVLAQKGGSVANPDLLGNWLYGVAVRVAQKARRTAVPPPRPRSAGDHHARSGRGGRRGAERHRPGASRRTQPSCPPCTATPWCCATCAGCRGRKQPTALGVPEGTLSSRLANGRKKLADRLARRGDRPERGGRSPRPSPRRGRPSFPKHSSQQRAGWRRTGRRERGRHRGRRAAGTTEDSTCGRCSRSGCIGAVAGGRRGRVRRPPGRKTRRSPRDPPKKAPAAEKVEVDEPDPRALKFTT